MPLSWTAFSSLVGCPVFGVHYTGNLVLAAFFAGSNDGKRLLRRDALLGKLTEYLKGDVAQRPTEEERQLRAGPRGITPFHWEIEYPEVFGRQQAGFDCIVGNPPFLGGKRISTIFGDPYRDWLVHINEHSNSNADLVAHFFRRVFALIRSRGCFGLIATNSIAQGDTRMSGLRFICKHDGVIYAARRRLKWPGTAAVVVSVLHIAKESDTHGAELDDKPAEKITAYLFHQGGHDDPIRLMANHDKSFAGCDIKGQGFLFDDDDEGATPLAAMNELIKENPHNLARIYPYIGGEEVNSSPNIRNRRFVINFGEMPLEDCPFAE